MSRSLKLHRSFLITACCAAVVMACGEDNTGPGTPPAGEVNDAVGDVDTADVVQAAAEVVGDSIRFSARFVPGQTGTGNLRLIFLLDTDEDVATGDDFTFDSAIGVDYYIQVDENAGSAVKYRFISGVWVDQGSGIGGVEKNGDIMGTTMPLNEFGAEDGHLRFKVWSLAVDQMNGGYDDWDLVTDMGVPGILVD